MKLPNLGYHLARSQGRLMRVLYALLLPLIVRWRLRPAHSFEADVFAYSGEESLPEQVASIRSFLKHVGRPLRFVVVSDGTHTARSIRLLEQLDPSVTVRQIPPATPSGKLSEYLLNHPTGKQLNLIMNLPEGRPAFYTDSDVLFFQGAIALREAVANPVAPARYLADCRFSGDERIVRGEKERAQPVNTGVLLLFQKLDWSLGLARFAELQGEPNFFTNQTITHLVMHDNKATPFDPGKYVLQLDDQFVYPDRYANASLALRHYVNPVRHKFWTSLNQ
jgi:hypothetical protein